MFVRLKTKFERMFVIHEASQDVLYPF